MILAGLLQAHDDVISFLNPAPFQDQPSGSAAQRHPVVADQRDLAAYLGQLDRATPSSWRA